MNTADMVRTPEEIASRVRHARDKRDRLTSSASASARICKHAESEYQSAVALLSAAVAAGMFKNREALIRELMEFGR